MATERKVFSRSMGGGIACLIFWLWMAFVFAVLFGSTYTKWQDEKSDHDNYRALGSLCTKLTMLPNSTGATIVFVDNEEYQLHNNHTCYAYLKQNGVDLLPERRRLVSSDFSQYFNIIGSNSDIWVTPFF